MIRTLVFIIIIATIGNIIPMKWNLWEYDHDEEMLLLIQHDQFSAPPVFGNIVIKHVATSFYVIKDHEEEIIIHPLNIAPELRFLTNAELLEFIKIHHILLFKNNIGLYALNFNERRTMDL